MIDSFSGKYRFLSNFWRATVNYENILYPTNEHAFQAAKTRDIRDRLRIASAETPSMAKYMGRRVKLREDWEQVKDQVMYDLCLEKFSKHEFLRESLLKTGDEELIEGNTWNDRIWGCTKFDGQWVGQNRLGKTLMQIREELRNGR